MGLQSQGPRMRRSSDSLPQLTTSQLEKAWLSVSKDAFGCIGTPLRPETQKDASSTWSSEFFDALRKWDVRQELGTPSTPTTETSSKSSHASIAESNRPSTSWPKVPKAVAETVPWKPTPSRRASTGNLDVVLDALRHDDWARSVSDGKFKARRASTMDVGLQPLCLERCSSAASIGVSTLTTSKFMDKYAPTSPTIKIMSTSASAKSLEAVQALEEEPPSEKVARTIMKMDSLFELRRVGRKQSTGIIGIGINHADEDGELESMLHAVLWDCNDTVAQLTDAEAEYSNATAVTVQLGGGGHASCAISTRTLKVLRRKLELMRSVEARMQTFERVHGQREALLKQTVETSSLLPFQLAGIKEFLADHTHVGNPAEANKSNFNAFVASFKLPRGHVLLRQFREMADSAGEWWAEACLQQAEKALQHSQLKRLFTVATGTGLDEDHPKLVKALRILIDRQAIAVLDLAKHKKQKDKELADKATAEGKLPSVGPASSAADAIEQSIVNAPKEGVPNSDSRLLEARRIVNTMRELDNHRKRTHAAYARAMKAQEDRAHVIEQLQKKLEASSFQMPRYCTSTVSA